MAVSDILQTPPELVAAALAADNVVIAVYFAFLFSLCRSSSEEELQSLVLKPVSGELTSHKLTIQIIVDTTQLRIFSNSPKLKLRYIFILEAMQPRSEVNLRTMSIAVAAGLIFCAVAETVGKKFSVSPMLLVSTFAVMAATLFPKAMGAISASGGIIGVLAMQVSYFDRVLSIFCLFVLLSICAFVYLYAYMCLLVCQSVYVGSCLPNCFWRWKSAFLSVNCFVDDKNKSWCLSACERASTDAN